MDLIDKKILCELDVNCRTPLSRLAKSLRIGRNVLDYRIKKMEKEKIITNYICSVNLGKLGYKTYKIYCKMRKMTLAQENYFVNYISDEKRILHFLKTEGSYDFAFVVAVQNIRELDDFISEIKTQFKETLHDYAISIVVYSKIYKMHKLLLGQKKEIKFDKYSEDKKEVELDDKDKKILRILSQSANISIVDLADKTGLSIDIVKYRVKELTERLVSSFRIIADMGKLGYFHYVIMLKIRNSSTSEEKDFMDWCANKNNILFTTKRIGFFDYEVNVAIKSIDDLNGFLAEMKSKFGNIIDSYELMINSKLLKLNYLPF